MSCKSRTSRGRTFALVTLGNDRSIVVRDITDVAHPTTRCTIYGGGFPRFVDASHVSYISSQVSRPNALYVVDLQSGHHTLIRALGQGIFNGVYAWSPDGKTLAYISSDGIRAAWHLWSAAGDVTLGDLGSIPGRGISSNSDDAMVGFSADGKYVSVEETFTANPFQIVRLADHKLVYSRTDGTMAVWARAGATLYYRSTSGLESWDPTRGTHLVIAQGFAWIHPWASADGKRIAYVDVDAKGYHYPGYVQISDGQAIRVSSRPRARAVFLTPTLMWYRAEATCSGPNAVCGLGEPTVSGRPYIYDVVAGTETPSIITTVFDSWPHSV